MTGADQESEQADMGFLEKKRRGGKSIWEWLRLVIIPLTLLGVSVLLNFAQDERQQRQEDNRAAVQATVEADRANANALQAYYDKMADLMLTQELKKETEIGLEARTIAQATTHATLRSLDSERKGTLISFLYIAELISEGNVIVALGRRADLSGADLHEAYLPDAFLRSTNLSGADLSGAGLYRAMLGTADLRGADLRGAYLVKAYLSAADLRGADLGGADLKGADLSGAYYDSATIWPDGFDPESAGAIMEE